MDLLKLVEPVDYVKQYSYEQRVDHFNKYKITPVAKNWIPIWELAQFIINMNMQNKNSYVFPYGHQQNILENSADRGIEDKNEQRIVVTNTGKSIIIKRYVKEEISMPKYGKYRNAIRFDLEPKTISIFPSLANAGVFQISRGIYEKIDEWLMDFGYEYW